MRYKINDELILCAPEYYRRFNGSLVKIVDIASHNEYKVVFINVKSSTSKQYPPRFIYPRESELIKPANNCDVNLELSFRAGEIL